MGGVHAGQ